MEIFTIQQAPAIKLIPEKNLVNRQDMEEL